MTQTHIVEGTLAGVPLFAVQGELNDDEACMLFEQCLMDKIGSGSRFILIDLADCPYINAEGLRVFLEAVRQVRSSGWVGVLATGPTTVLFKVMGLPGSPGFRLFSSSGEAVSELERSRASDDRVISLDSHRSRRRS